MAKSDRKAASTNEGDGDARDGLDAAGGEAPSAGEQAQADGAGDAPDLAANARATEERELAAQRDR